MTVLLRRDFVVGVPRSVAWDYLARLAEWPRWAQHIRRVEVYPAGNLSAGTSGTIHLRNGIRSTFRMIEFRPQENWKWSGPFLWLDVHYDHRFEPINEQKTRLVLVLEAQGIGVSVFGRLFALMYARNLDAAIPRLIRLMESR